MDIDNLDKKVINVLIENSRLSYRQLAKKVNVSTATIMHRINKLEKTGIIKKYSTVIDYDKLGYDIHVLIQVRVAKGKLFEVEKKIAIHNNVQIVYDTTGHFDAIIIARFKTKREMDRLLKKIQTYDFVERTETLLILNAIKEEPIKL